MEDHPVRHAEPAAGEWPAGPNLLTEPPRRAGSLAGYAVVALVVVLAAAATWFVIAWTQARDDWTAANDAWLTATGDLLRTDADDSIAAAKVRDEVITVGRAEVITFHTLDYRKADEGLDNWEKASTGALHDDVMARRATSRQSIEGGKTSTTAKVLSVALTGLDAPAGKATMITAMELTVIADGKQPERKYLRIQAALQRTGAGWKLSGIGSVPVAG